LALFPKEEWTPLSHRLIFHGRRVCHARRPACGACPVAALCPSRTIGETDPIKAEALLRPASAIEAALFPPLRLVKDEDTRDERAMDVDVTDEPEAAHHL